MLSKIDQENLEKKIQNWMAENSQNLFLLRPCSLSHVEANPREETEKDGNVEADVTEIVACSSNSLAEAPNEPLW